MYNSSDDNNVGSLRIMNRRVHFKDFALLTFIIGKKKVLIKDFFDLIYISF